jgi:hypothetical protein
LRLKLALIFVGAPLALASSRLGQRWLFYVGLALLVVALALPAQPGRSFKERAGDFVRHFPGARWFRR